MAEFRSRTPLTALLVGLVAFAVVAMVVDRRSMREPDRQRSGWRGVVLDIAAPVEKVIALPFESLREGWRRYASLVDVEENNQTLRSQLAVLEEENLQLREALVASGRLERIAEIRGDFEIPMLP